MFLFKDYVSCLRYIDKKFINDIGIGNEYYCEKTHGFELDSSCVVIDKEKAWEALYAICIINVESDSYYNSKVNNVLGDKDTWLIGSMFVNFDAHVSEADPGVFLIHDTSQSGHTSPKGPSERAQSGHMKVVYGHLQSQKSDNFDDLQNLEGKSNIPLYYNNQAIDLIDYDGDSSVGSAPLGVNKFAIDLNFITSN